jgi:hypothetical protein
MISSLIRQTALSRHPRMLLALPAAAALAVTLAACGSSGNPSAHPATPKSAGAAHSHTHSAPTHAAVTTPPASPATAPAPPPPTMAPTQPANPIPQGNGGDQDADNNGGPSDGDGNI